MSTILGSLSEIATSLFQSLRLSYIVPGFIFWVLNAIFILPSIPDEVRVFLSRLVKSFSLEPVALISILSLLSGYFFYVLNTPIIRWFEGYPWRDFPLTRWLADRKIEGHRFYRDRLIAKYTELGQQCDYLKINLEQRLQKLGHAEPKRKQIEKQFEQKRQELRSIQTSYAKKIQMLYPTTELPFLPTRLGNVIAAFEDYPHSQYGMDSVTLWPRFIPILAREKYSPYLENEKANLDFLLNLCLVLLFFCVELFMVGCLYAADLTVWLIAIGFLLTLIYLLYVTSITGARGWGIAVKVAFDLYRYELLAALRGNTPKNFKQEKEGLSHPSNRLKRSNLGDS